MKEQFVPYEQALALKELGFDEECFGYYYLDSNNKSGLTQPQSSFKRWYTGKEVLAPLWQQAFDWFRKEHKLCFTMFPNRENKWTCNITTVNKNYNLVDSCYGKSYEEAQLACLEKLIEIIKNK